MTTKKPRSERGESPVPPWVSGAFLPPPRDWSGPPDQAEAAKGGQLNNGPAPDTFEGHRRRPRRA